MAGQPLTIHGTGEQRKDYIHVSDIATAFWAARDLPASTISYIGTGETTSVNEIAEKILAVTGSKSEVVYVDSPRHGEKELMEGERLALLGTGWTPKVSFEQGLRKVKEHYEKSL